MTKATEKGLQELANKVLSDHFQLAEPQSAGEANVESKNITASESKFPSVSLQSQKIAL